MLVKLYHQCKHRAVGITQLSHSNNLSSIINLMIFLFLIINNKVIKKLNRKFLTISLTAEINLEIKTLMIQTHKTIIYLYKTH
jgi:hypothetical protein